jgi:hypothetical protein
MIRVCLALMVLLGLAGCGLRPQLVDPASTGQALFRPVTQAPPTTPTVPPPASTPRPTPVLACIDKLTYVSDQTIPDGTQVAPDSSLDKRWEVENSGTCNWDERYHLRLIGGPDLGANPVQPLFPARSGSTAVIRILMTAPSQTGTYRSAWQAYNPNDEPFGDPFYIEIVVK